MDEQWMARSLSLARGTYPHPNPRVGAVVVASDGTVAGEGSHAGPGTPHAEVVALTAAGDAARDATIYVSLEPCSHYGRTPPCVNAILEAGIRRVVVAVGDPDRRVAGKGIEALQAAGLDVEVGLLQEEAEALDPGYFHHRRTGRPMVTLKSAATLDGQVAAMDGSSQWITGEAARTDAHRLRSAVDAVMVGAGTIRADDPRLDVRLDGYAGPQPVPVVVAGAKPIPPESAVLARDPIVLSPVAIDGVEAVIVPEGDWVDLRAGLVALGGRGIIDVLVEGGPTLAASLLSADLVDRIVLYLGARLAGGAGKSMFHRSFRTLGEARSVRVTSVASLGPDVKIEASLE